MSDPQAFMTIQRKNMASQPVELRIHNWNEVYRPLEESDAREQARRCMDCGVPFCQSTMGCPVENLIPDWNELVSMNKWQEAFLSLHKTNNFPEWTGRLCPAPCESACVAGAHSVPVAIRSTELSIIEKGFKEGWVVPQIALFKTGKKVAIIGSGPAGLAAAQQLVRSGHEVTIFEKAPQVGGLLRYGIPNFKMEKDILERRLTQLRDEGIIFKTNISVGLDLSLLELTREFDAIGLTMGAEEPRDLQIPGRELQGIHLAMDYLSQFSLGTADTINASGKRVVIIGGGDTGSDCLGSVIRQGAKSAYQFELMPKPPKERSASTPWPLWPLMLKTSHAHEEGGRREWCIVTNEFIGENNHVSAVRTQRVTFENGVMTPVVNSEEIIEADLVLLAMGFVGAKKSGLINQLVESQGVQLDSRGNIQVDAKFHTSAPKYFAAGDVKRGASLIVWAIAEGRKMASGMNDFLLS
jgi:glutamate synthase (NADPH/NADH) small chain